jgi:hypothetical protein
MAIELTVIVGGAVAGQSDAQAANRVGHALALGGEQGDPDVSGVLDGGSSVEEEAGVDDREDQKEEEPAHQGELHGALTGLTRALPPTLGLGDPPHSCLSSLRGGTTRAPGGAKPEFTE